MGINLAFNLTTFHKPDTPFSPSSILENK